MDPFFEDIKEQFKNRQKSQKIRNFKILFFQTDSGLVVYHEDQERPGSSLSRQVSQTAM